MLLKTVFTILLLVAVSSCRSVPEVPDFEIGTGVFDQRLETSYVKFVSYHDPRNIKKHRKLFAPDFFQTKPVCVTKDGYFDLLKWGREAEIKVKELERKLQSCQSGK